MKKKVATSLAFLILGGGGITSCNTEDKAEEAVARLSIDTHEATLARNGKSPLDQDVKFRVIANKGYEITSEQDWLGVDKPTGHGLNDVLIVAKENESGALRTGTLLVRSGNLYEELVVTQTEQAPDPMRLFYHQDFEWCIPLAQPNSDPVGDQDTSGKKRQDVLADPIKSGWESTGLTIYNMQGKQVSAYISYIHFNNNFKKYHPEYKSYDAGVILPRLDLGTEKVNAVITVQICPEGSLKSGLDKVPFVVSIESGSGYVGATGSAKKSPVFTPPTVQLMWHTVEYVLRDISSDTRIALRTDGNTADYCRWMLNEISLKETKL